MANEVFGEKRPPEDVLLVIEDDPQVQGLLSEGLELDGVSMVIASSGAEGRKIANDRKPLVVLLDIGLPDISGLNLLGELLSMDPGLMVIMLTGHSDEMSVVEAMRKGALDYISKPFKLTEVREKVLAALVRAKRNKVARGKQDGDADDVGISGMIIGKSAGMMEVFKQIGRLSASEVPVLITGESGTGKELVAKALHRYGPRSAGPFITVDCAGIPIDLLESELFGYERGAFTGSVNAKPGRLEMASGGTLFLDEVGNIPPAIQPKLLRALQEKTSQRLGSNTSVKWDARIVSATNSDLHRLARGGRFREDLIFRIAGGEIAVPPLRERAGDIPILSRFFMEKIGGVTANCRFSAEAMKLMDSYGWPGNVRELEHVVNHASALARGGVIGPEDLPEKVGNGLVGEVPGKSPDSLLSMEDMKARYAAAMLEECKGNKTEAARRLGIDRKTLGVLLKRASDGGKRGDIPE